MRVPWIRVHGGLYDRPVVDRLSRALRIREHEAIGILVTFWSGVASHSNNGQIATISDSQLEKWAKWTRKRGAFAAWVREEHQDAEGRVPEWDDYAGALELRREKERQRLADRRQRLRDATQGVAQQTRNNLQPLQPARAVRDGTVRNGTEPKEKPVPEWLEPAVAFWTAKVGHTTPTKLRRALASLVTATDWPTVLAALEVYVSPDEGPTGARKPEWFAENFQRYHTIASTPLADADGVMTERGRRLMRRGVA